MSHHVITDNKTHDGHVIDRVTLTVANGHVVLTERGLTGVNSVALRFEELEQVISIYNERKDEESK